ncbi:MAG: hypothetical protein JEZ07_18990, partial [Phycisphaerae bacterium]|nr:hypothetical protein [Phycisphaerae bacterium]
MKKNVLTKWFMAIAIVATFSGSASAALLGDYSGTFVDATLSNTAPVDAVTYPNQSDWLSTEQTENLWWHRSGFGEDGYIFEGNNNGNIAGDCPMLATTITGLTAGDIFNISVVFHAQPIESDKGTDWSVNAGLSSANLELCNMANSTDADLDDSDGTINRSLFENTLGTGTAVNAGEKVQRMSGRFKSVAPVKKGRC